MSRGPFQKIKDLQAEELGSLLTCGHLAEDVEGSRTQRLHRVDAAGPLPLCKQILTVPGHSWNPGDKKKSDQMIQQSFSFTAQLINRVINWQKKDCPTNTVLRVCVRTPALWTRNAALVSRSNVVNLSAKVNVCLSSQGHLNPSLEEQRYKAGQSLSHDVRPQIPSRC